MNKINPWKPRLSLILLSLFVAACTFTQPQPSATLQGRVLLWHAWPEPKAAALTAVLNRFQALYPEVVVKQQTFATPAALLSQFQTAAAAGLGPDLILAPSGWIRPLHEAKLIDNIAAVLPSTTIDRFWPAARTAMRYQGGIYGLPLAVETMVLYYDRRLVEQPPATLDELLAAAKDGQIVELSTTFVDAFWGVQAFGGQLLDSDGRVTLDQGGFAEWLAWLETARATPDLILEANRAALLERFIAGGVAYYVGQTNEYAAILAGRTPDPAAGNRAAVAQIGVAALPQGPSASAGPFLQTEGLLFSNVSSANQRVLALALAQAIGVLPTTTDMLGRQLGAYLHDQSLLLVFDDFDHLIAGASFIVELLQEAPLCKVLVTARQALQLPGEVILPVEGLALPTAMDESLILAEWKSVAERETTHTMESSLLSQKAPALHLFLHALQRQIQQISLSVENLQTILHICRLVEGNPLAITQAAALSLHYSWLEIAEQLAHCLAILQAAYRSDNPGQRGMMTVLEEGWCLLTQQEQAILTALTSFPGAFTRHDAVVHTGSSAEILIALVNKSWVRSKALGFMNSRASFASLCKQKHRGAPLYKVTITQRREYPQWSGWEYWRGHSALPRS